jgi:oligoribonuclease NrnB/cAMP/cGMP phosphodiesterase (DHH superfamily)
MERPLIIYHAACPDGFTAAWCAYRRFGPDCDFLPAHYGQNPPVVHGRRVFVLDFSYRRNLMLIMASEASELTILDHHKTAKEDLDGFADECACGYGLRPPTVVFDMEKSGARLAWEHFFPDEPAPWLIQYVEDRDLRRWTLPRSREVNAAIASYPFTFERWSSWDRFDRHQGWAGDWLGRRMAGILGDMGEHIERYKVQQVENICQHAHEIEMDGHRVLAVNTSILFSEVAGELAKNRPFGAAWFVRADGKKQWSLRSREGGVDVSEIALRRGGGGHRHAAGFEEA